EIKILNARTPPLPTPHSAQGRASPTDSSTHAMIPDTVRLRLGWEYPLLTNITKSQFRIEDFATHHAQKGISKSFVSANLSIKYPGGRGTYDSDARRQIFTAKSSSLDSASNSQSAPGSNRSSHPIAAESSSFGFSAGTCRFNVRS